MHFSDLAFANACPTNRFLDEMASTIPWDVFDQELKRAIHHKTGGRPPYERLLLFKMHLLQVWYGLSDAQTEFQCNDRLSFRRFLGLGLEQRIPDSTTLETFRHELEATGLDHSLLETLDVFFREKGLLLKEGSVVDATFIQANSRPKKDPEAQSDLDAEHGHKGFGYSATVNVDRKSKLIRRVVTTSERPHDSQNLGAVLVGDEQRIYADSAYAGQEAVLERWGLRSHFLKKRKRGKQGEPPKPLPLRDKYRQQLYSRLRAVGEHPFAVVKGVFGLVRTRYRGLERVAQQVASACLGYNLKRYGYLCRA